MSSQVSQKTFSQKQADVTRSWYIIDASDIPLGRLSTEVATLLTGKKKPTYTPHTDGGDFVVIINADKVKLTGQKETDKVYYRHSGYIGNLRERTAKEQRERNSIKLIEKSVKGMLPKNKLTAGRLERLKVYTDAAHKHEAQKPQTLTIGDK
ncbi:MAG: 50S ribosomal protein L13 [Patescibacteria group bacterium]